MPTEHSYTCGCVTAKHHFSCLRCGSRVWSEIGYQKTVMKNESFTLDKALVTFSSSMREAWDNIPKNTDLIFIRGALNEKHKLLYKKLLSLNVPIVYYGFNKTGLYGRAESILREWGAKSMQSMSLWKVYSTKATEYTSGNLVVINVGKKLVPKDFAASDGNALGDFESHIISELNAKFVTSIIDNSGRIANQCNSLGIKSYTHTNKRLVFDNICGNKFNRMKGQNL